MRKSSELDLDLPTFGRRLRHLRRTRKLTLAALALRVGVSTSTLSMIENGRREPRVSLLGKLAEALGVPLEELLRPEAPDRRAALEIALERAQREERFARLGLAPLRPGSRVPTDVLEHLVVLHEELRTRGTRLDATPESARRANAELRRRMREQDNYFPEIEHAAAETLRAVGYASGPLPQRTLNAVVRHHGFTVHPVEDLPAATRSVTDTLHRRIYLPRRPAGHDPRYLLLRTLGHIVLGHREPVDFADFLRQRVEANYFAAATLVPESAAVPVLVKATRDGELSMEDLRDVFAVSHETAAHRFTNLATHHLGLTTHFTRTDAAGTVLKAYENDGIPYPADRVGAIEGQLTCREFASRRVFGSGERYGTYVQLTETPAGDYVCTSHVEPSADGEFAITVGAPASRAGWFRGSGHAPRRRSACPDPRCCTRPPRGLERRWAQHAVPSAKAHSHLLTALPPGAFPGVDTTEVYDFLERHSADEATDPPR